MHAASGGLRNSIRSIRQLALDALGLNDSGSMRKISHEPAGSRCTREPVLEITRAVSGLAADVLLIDETMAMLAQQDSQAVLCPQASDA
ncbi:hypothetical protein [Mesorhizobium delmotii]|uniref:Uncharacterized protein n=1 Tax=Mesorhizobium delmotii TaxID=1631247 RepID=A0A2P9AT33_9HYPH|nr:hypothetical protein [Mesorhizobium delmotii]SJM34284.1 hypothetical protein BQ8482_400013 [Mesorhizobium delmotii]